MLKKCVVVLLGVCAMGAGVAWGADVPRERVKVPVKVPVQEPAVKEGTVTGTVTETGEGWVRVKDASGASERYSAMWNGGMPKDGGGLDKEMVAKIKALKAGDKVTLKWKWVERKRVVEITVDAPAADARK